MTRYLLYRREGGPQGRVGRVRKISPPPGFDFRTVQLRISVVPNLTVTLLKLIGLLRFHCSWVTDFTETEHVSGFEGQSCNSNRLIPNIPPFIFFLGGGGGTDFVPECVHEGLPDQVQPNHRCLCCAAVIPATPGESQ